MTTEATENPQPPVMDVTEVYRLLGRLEQAQEGTKEQIAEIKELLARHEERNEQQFARHEERNEQQFARHEERNEQQFARHEERNEQRFARQEERSDRQEEVNEQRYRESSRRIDRLWYGIVGGTIAILSGMAGLAVQNVLMG